MLCLIVAYKSHRRDQWLESFVWGRPLAPHLSRLPGHSIATCVAALQSLQRLVGLEVVAFQMAPVQESVEIKAIPPRSQQQRNMESKKHANNMQTTMKKSKVHLTHWLNESVLQDVGVASAQICVVEGLKIHKLKNTTCLEDSPSTPSLTGTVLVAGSMACPSNMWNRNRFGILTLMPSTQAATQQEEAKFVRICYTKNLPGTCQPNSINLASNEANHASIRMPASSYAVLNLVWYFWQWFQLCIHWTHLWPLKPASLMLMTAPCKDRHPVKWNLLKSRLPSTP